MDAPAAQDRIQYYISINPSIQDLLFSYSTAVLRQDEAVFSHTHCSPLRVNHVDLHTCGLSFLSIKGAIHSVKQSDFTVWRHTWQKNWVNYALLIDNSAGLRIVLSGRLSHTQKCAVHTGNPTVSSFYLPTPRWHHLKAHPFLAIHSADGHRMIPFQIPLLTPHFTLSFLLFG
jgi:hypothetical protein